MQASGLARQPPCATQLLTNDPAAQTSGAGVTLHSCVQALLQQQHGKQRADLRKRARGGDVPRSRLRGRGCQPHSVPEPPMCDRPPQAWFRGMERAPVRRLAWLSTAAGRRHALCGRTRALAGTPLPPLRYTRVWACPPTAQTPTLLRDVPFSAICAPQHAPHVAHISAAIAAAPDLRRGRCRADWLGYEQAPHLPPPPPPRPQPSQPCNALAPTALDRRRPACASRRDGWTMPRCAMPSSPS